MNILSLFDGIAGAYQALKNINIEIDNYFASEIDKYAIQIAMKNHPKIKQLGDVCFLNTNILPKIDLLIGGSPCTNLSIAGDRKGLKGSQSQLFFEYLRILKETKPKFFIFENVASMKKSDMLKISTHIGFEPIMINSSLLTAQQRKRLYWIGKLVNGKYKKVEIEQPEDKGMLLKDVLENYDNQICCASRGRNLVDGKRIDIKGAKTEQRLECRNDEKTNCLTTVQKDNLILNKPIRIGQFNSGGQGDRIYSIDGKSVCLSANGGGRGAKTGLYELNNNVRKLTPIECERLQGFPDNYTDSVSNTQRYKALGNSFTVPVIEHILKFLIK